MFTSNFKGEHAAKPVVHKQDQRPKTIGIMDQDQTYHGRVFCVVLSDNPEYDQGMRGAFVPICSSAANYVEALGLISSELAEHHLQLEGTEQFFNEKYFDGVPSKDMSVLLDRLSEYPVQFSDVHYFPADS